MQNTHPELNQRAQGWLNFLYRKATTPDDWSDDGNPNDYHPQTNLSLIQISEPTRHRGI